MYDSILYTNKLAVGYNNSILIENINIKVERGQIVTLIGPNGVGKSTILKSIIQQLDKISGEIYINNTNLMNINKHKLSKIMSILMTERIKSEFMTCEDVVKSGRYPYTGQFGILSDYDKKQVSEAMKLTSVKEISDRDFNHISDGQKQRVMLARAICQEPDILILDEPTSFLDIHHKLELLNILKKLVREKNIAVIMSMHELDFAQRISDYVVCINNNKIDRCGVPDEIFNTDYITKLYNLKPENYNEYYGCVELEAIKGNFEVFVIAGGGKGINTFRKLQRMNIPFATGIIHENDIDFPVSKALASEVVSEKAFETIKSENINRAIKLIDKCKKVICCLDSFATINEGNSFLMKYAVNKNLLST